MDELEPSGLPGDVREPTLGRGAVPLTAPPAPRARVPAAAAAAAPSLPSTEAVLPWRAALPGRLVHVDDRASPATAVAITPPKALPGERDIWNSREVLLPAFTVSEAHVPPHAPARPHARAAAAVAEPVSYTEATEAPAEASGGEGPNIWVRRGARLAAAALMLCALWFVSVLGMIVAYRFIDPPFSNLMLAHRLSGEVVVQKWLPIERIPVHLIRAIVVSEDGRFCSHNGIDLKEIELAIERSKDGTPRGASTITMQVAKNLFLWPSKSYVRKALEVPLTLAIEAMWSKRRIFEVYANIAEWGPGVFGAEAAAGYHFGKSVARIGEREAALLAVALPNPVTRDAGDPGPGTERLANIIQDRMRAMSRAATCVERQPRG